MIETVQATGAFLGMLAIIIGAFGAHALKKVLSKEQLVSFETGVKYQMYHALLLLLLGFNLPLKSTLEHSVIYCLILGTLLFSFSIYGLCLSTAKGNKWKWLGPVTPLGGLLLVTGWSLLLYAFLE